MTRPARIPSDVNRPDRILGPLTARQVAILAATAAALYLGWAVLRAWIPTPILLAAAVPISTLTFVVAVGHRDGITLDRFLLAAIRHHLRPTHLTIDLAVHRSDYGADPSTDHGATPSAQLVAAGYRPVTPPHRAAPTTQKPTPPLWLEPDLPDLPGIGAARGRARWGRALRQRCRTGSERGGFPVRGIEDVDAGAGRDPVGVIDLGGEGAAVIAVVSSVNLTLRSGAEQDGLVDAFARYLHTFTGPVQILVRAVPLDLTAHLTALREQSSRLPHPALAGAAADHARHLVALAAHRGAGELLTRQILLVLREPTPTGRDTATAAASTRLLRRVHDAAALLTPLDVTLTTLTTAQITALLVELTQTRQHHPANLDERRDVGRTHLGPQTSEVDHPGAGAPFAAPRWDDAASYAVNELEDLDDHEDLDGHPDLDDHDDTDAWVPDPRTRMPGRGTDRPHHAEPTVTPSSTSNRAAAR